MILWAVSYGFLDKKANYGANQRLNSYVSRETSEIIKINIVSRETFVLYYPTPLFEVPISIVIFVSRETIARYIIFC